MSKKYNNSFSVGLAPKNGNEGPPGPTYYPAGIYDPDTQYIRTKATVPFVLSPDNGKYYVLEKFGVTQGVDPETDTSGVWVEFDYIKYAFFEIIMANFGKLASAVFSGDVMMSQYGIDGTDNYQNYTDQAGAWQPNILLNFLDGSGHFARRNIRWNSQGGAVFTGGVVSPFVQVNDALIQPNSDNLPRNVYAFYRGTTTSPAYYYTLPCEKELSGLVVRIHNIQGGRSGSMTINAPQSNAFYEDGTIKSNLDLGFGHAIELICVADNVGFHSWDVIRRYQCRPYNN